MENNMNHIYYWDSSAVLSLLIKDNHSKIASKLYDRNNVNLISSLVLSEVFAVLARIQRENIKLKILLDASREALRTGKWRIINISPEFELIKKYSEKYPLRGADLWHLCLVLQLQNELTNIKIITFDSKLENVAKDLNL
jgi:predicted nucleic acid-binding protein